MKRKLFYLWMLLSVSVSSATFMTSCDSEPLDEGQIWDRLDDLEDRVSSLEAWQASVNGEISALRALVEATEGGDYVTDVKQTAEGVEITFAKSGKFTLTNGKNGDGSAPVVGVEKADGVYYWTLDGEWLTDDEDNKMPVSGVNGEDGVTPLLSIDEEGYWQVSTDGGESWELVLDAEGEPVSAKGEAGDSYFESVEVAEDGKSVTVTLADGTEFELAVYSEETPMVEFTNKGKMLDYDMDENGHYTGLRSTTVKINLPEEEVSAIMAQLLYPDSNGDIITRADQKVRIELPDEWDGTAKVYIDVQEALKAILEVRVVSTSGVEYVCARSLDTTPLVEFVAYADGAAVYAPNTVSAEVKLNFIEGIDKVKRLAIGAMSVDSYADGTEFRRSAQTSFDMFDKGTDLESYYTIPYYVFQGEELKTDNDGYLHVDEDKLLFNARMVDGEYVPTRITAFAQNKKYIVATYVEYSDGGFDLINTTWTAPALAYDGTVTPTFTEKPVFNGNVATAKVTAEGAAKLATFVIDDGAAYQRTRLDYYIDMYENRFHAYEGEKEFSGTAAKNGQKYYFVAIAIDKDGKIGEPAIEEITYGIVFGDNGGSITSIDIQKQTLLDHLNFTLKADADEVRFKIWDVDTWGSVSEGSTGRDVSAEKLESFFMDEGSIALGEKLKKSGSDWVPYHENEGITITHLGYTKDIEGDDDGYVEGKKAEGAGKFYIFFNTKKDGNYGNIYALYGDQNDAKLVNVTEMGYDVFTQQESDYIYTSAKLDELEESGGDGGEEEDLPEIWDNTAIINQYLMGNDNSAKAIWISAKAGYTVNKVWVIKVDGNYEDAATAKTAAESVLKSVFAGYTLENPTDPNGKEVVYATDYEITTSYPAVKPTISVEVGDAYVYVAQDDENKLHRSLNLVTTSSSGSWISW